ncbi:hypothetical protein SASPL_130236 [Salvia splendens]|uniref:Uncharacterized protein n=1 Tax=Salvia splendens TaxID=180675 RepID=A0A8X8X3U9_SALSN|nr:hypothetical protein SASPL_130236 [Salvia splendens]
MKNAPPAIDLFRLQKQDIQMGIIRRFKKTPTFSQFCYVAVSIDGRGAKLPPIKGEKCKKQRKGMTKKEAIKSEFTREDLGRQSPSFRFRKAHVIQSFAPAPPALGVLTAFGSGAQFAAATLRIDSIGVPCFGVGAIQLRSADLIPRSIIGDHSSL